MVACISVCVFFFKQKTAYEMRISDWSSDVCSSDLSGSRLPQRNPSRAALKPAAIPPNVAIARSVDIASDEMTRALPRAPMKGHTIQTPVFKQRQPARPSTDPADKPRGRTLAAERGADELRSIAAGKYGRASKHK